MEPNFPSKKVTSKGVVFWASHVSDHSYLFIRFSWKDMVGGKKQPEFLVLHVGIYLSSQSLYRLITDSYRSALLNDEIDISMFSYHFQPAFIL